MGRRAIAAVEFAIVVPLLLVMLIGTIEVLTLYRTEAKLNALAYNVGYMISAEASPLALTANGPSVQDACTGAVLGLQPFFPGANLSIDVASVTMEPAKLSSNVAGSPVVYDEWEAQTNSGAGGCASPSTTTGTILGGTTPPTMAAGMLAVPCDNVIIVRAGMQYPGLTGLIVRARPTLTQTAYVRWAFAAPTAQLLCSGCAVPATAEDFCNNKSAGIN
jgi:hypothetical protein